MRGNRAQRAFIGCNACPAEQKSYNLKANYEKQNAE